MREKQGDLVEGLIQPKMDTYELIGLFQQAIIDLYKKENLTSLRGLNHEYIVNGRQIIVWHGEVTRKCALQHNGKFSYFKNFDDLIFCSDELLYFTAHLFLYRPYVNNPLKEAFEFQGRMIYPNYQNMGAKRYSMFADVASQKVYNYWDRIGDLIASFFPDRIKPHQVFFPTAIEIIPKNFHQSTHYKWLKSFKETEYLELNQIRKQIVHYFTSDTDYKHDHLKNMDDKEAIEEIQSKRESIADFYKNHINLSLEGFEQTLLFLEDVNHILYP